MPKVGCIIPPLEQCSVAITRPEERPSASDIGGPGVLQASKAWVPFQRPRRKDPVFLTDPKQGGSASRRIRSVARWDDGRRFNLDQSRIFHERGNLHDGHRRIMRADNIAPDPANFAS